MNESFNIQNNYCYNYIGEHLRILGHLYEEVQSLNKPMDSMIVELHHEQLLKTLVPSPKEQRSEMKMDPVSATGTDPKPAKG